MMNGIKHTLKRFLEVTSIQSISGNESSIISYLKAFLDHLKIDYEEDNAFERFGGNSGNLICKVNNSRQKGRFLLSAHVDTISATTKNPLIINGKIVSPDDNILGADDRVGVTILMQILELISRKKIDYPNLEILFLVAEEIGCKGSQNLDYSRIEAKYGFNLDCSASLGNVIVKAPAAVDFDLIFQGRNAHSAVEPDNGIHAILMASKALANISIPPKDKDCVFNIGTISGGRKNNVIPDKVVVTGEIRSFDSSIVDRKIEEIQKAISPAIELFGGKYRLKTETRYQAFELDPDNSAYIISKNAIEKSGIRFKPISYFAGSDANSLNSNGIATVNLGLGYAKNHSPDEYIEIQTLEKGVEMGIAIVEEAARYKQ